jgi:hypothetical protein
VAALDLDPLGTSDSGQPGRPPPTAVIRRETRRRQRQPGYRPGAPDPCRQTDPNRGGQGPTVPRSDPLTAASTAHQSSDQRRQFSPGLDVFKPIATLSLGESPHFTGLGK